MQQKQEEWKWQWEQLRDECEWLFRDWIAPNTLEDFRGTTVLDCGCGSGQHIGFTAPYAKTVTGIDLNATSIAKERTSMYKNVILKEADIASMNLGEIYDIVYSIGVLHHTDNPTASFQNIARHCTSGGKVIVWVYSKEGNALNEYLLEPMKTLCIRWLPRRIVWWIGHILTAIVYIPVWTIYLLPLKFLPFFEYFQNWRKLSYQRNFLNVFDKLNAPQTWFISRNMIEAWFNQGFTNVHISPYRGVSWRGSGTKIV